MGKKICIHGHFYQPSRENPWTGIVEKEPSAAPWQNWNERITDECYLPNSAARILDGNGRIRAVSNNYARISGDFGPTLLAWMERVHPGVYDSIISADSQAQDRFSGHGSAIAHPYHHVILPLLPREDKEIEIRWGIRDFEDRFGRYPEGMWLPEMAVDQETLTVLADHGIAYTVLSPNQGCQPPQEVDERPVPGRGIDTSAPYFCSLPGGGDIAIFFHDASIGLQVAFGDLLENGDRFADRLLSASPLGGLVHFATDGETFGHHHRFGEMALAWCLDRIDTSAPETLTVYGEYLAGYPPKREAEIISRTSWSCPHGISRWHEGCSCDSGRHEGWSHEWRGPLHTAIRGLSSVFHDIYSREAALLFSDPKVARDDSVRLFRTGAEGYIAAFFHDHATRPLSREEQDRALALLELSRQGLAMQTSCAWFFDDIADREAVQALRFAARALQIAGDLTGTPIEEEFLARLAAIPGNRGSYPDGGVVYRECVLPLVMTRKQQAACLALGDAVGVGTTLLSTNPVTGEYLSCGELWPDHDLSLRGGPIRYCFLSRDATTALLGLSFHPGVAPIELSTTLKKEGYDATAERLSALFCPVIPFSEFPPAGQRLVAHAHLDRTMRAFDDIAGVLFAHSQWGASDDAKTRFPPVTRLAWYVLSCRLDALLSSPTSTTEELFHLVAEFKEWGFKEVPLNQHPGAGYFLLRMMREWATMPGERDRLDSVIATLTLFCRNEAACPTWELQNLFIGIRDGPARAWEAGMRLGDDAATAWWERFRHLGTMLGVSVAGGTGTPFS
ncbi:MAG: DUF3536 domain-containing protein [Methanomicrobiales archaeon]